jgi:hypothetical protein
MRKLLALLTILLILLTGCSTDNETTERSACGNGICQATEEQRGLCEEDCNTASDEHSASSYDHDTQTFTPITIEETWNTPIISTLIAESSRDVDGVTVIKEDYIITNPTTEAELDVSVFSPSTGKHPGVILVPGGTGSKEDFLEEKKEYGDVTSPEMFAAEGFIIIIFSADGRGESTGTEDYNGYAQQDGLYEIYRFLTTLENVDEEKSGIVSYSYGIAMASGMIGRYQPDLLYYIAWEGPPDRWFVSHECGGVRGAVPDDITCDDEAYWEEREALRFVPYFPVDHFIIVQRENDHARDDFFHSLTTNNYAINYLDWVRVNDGTINQEYTLDTFPALEGKDFQTHILEYVKELTT